MVSAPKLYRPHHHQTEAHAQREKWERSDLRRGSSAARGYGGRWQASRKGYLARHPLCVCCLANGRVAVATMVDHSIPHKGDMALFWDASLWQSLCDDCNQRIKQPLELAWGRGEVPTTDLRLDRPMPHLFP